MIRPIAATLALLGVALPLISQPPAPPNTPPRTGKQGALEDLTGYWVSLVTEDWRWRMVTPAKGDAASIPISPEGRKAMDAWDPAKDEATGDICKAFGAPGLMRRPTRLHITWQDDNTLKVETDEGTQTRLFHFNAQTPANEQASLQGYSVATWQGGPPAGGRGGGGGAAAGQAPTGIGVGAAGGGAGRGAPPPPAAPMGPGSLKVVTTHLKPGYLRANGVPYGAQASLTEYFTVVDDPSGEKFLILTSAVEDPVYLRGDFLTSTHYLKEPDGSKWDPSPCRAK